jgi:hypothetical protein
MVPTQRQTLHWLLLAVTIAGSLPIRVCTCGASLHLSGSPFSFSLAAGRFTDPPAPPPLTPIWTLEDLQPLEQHDPDCHLVRPRPLISVGLLPDGLVVWDWPEAILERVGDRVDVLGHPSCHPTLVPHPPPLLSLFPLHLLLCLLRN